MAARPLHLMSSANQADFKDKRPLSDQRLTVHVPLGTLGSPRRASRVPWGRSSGSAQAGGLGLGDESPGYVSSNDIARSDRESICYARPSQSRRLDCGWRRRRPQIFRFPTS